MAPSKSRKSRKTRKSRSSKASRKASRKTTRKTSRRSRRNKRGGFMAPVNDTSMAMPQRDSLVQGSQYLNLHKGQYGGSAAYPSSVLESTLPSNMVASARTGPLESAFAGIRGMQDGGLRKKRKQTRRGGAFQGSPLSANSMLLPPGLEKQAALNYEWSMAKDPSAFAPKQ